jgi:hypothetical protein
MTENKRTRKKGAGAEVEQKAKLGRPLAYPPEKLDEFNEKIEEYFLRQDAQDRPYTITGLALAVGMDRDRLIQYENREPFYDTIKRAKQRVHEYVEERLFGGCSATGVIFSLKNNFGWKDKTEVDQNLNVTGDVETMSREQLLKIASGRE